MFHQPALRSEWTIVGTTSNGVLLAREGEIRAKEGTGFRELLPALREGLPLSALLKRLAGRLSRAEILAILEDLERDNLLRDGPEPCAPAEAAYWSLAGVEPQAQAPRSVTLAADDSAVAGEFATALTRMGVKIESSAPSRIVVVRDPCGAALAEWNARALAERTAWMLVRPYGREVWVGPLFEPGRTACWACLERRLRQNGWTAAASIAALPASINAALHLAAVQAARWLRSGGNEEISGTILSLDTAGWRTSRHAVARWPQCPVCGGGRKRYPVPVMETHLSLVTGLLGNVRETQLAPAAFLAESELAQVFYRDRSGSVSLNRRMAIGGKGSTAEAARLSCIGEAVERYSLSFHGDEPVSTTGTPLLRLHDLLCFSTRQVRNRQEWNQRHGGFHTVPEPLESDANIERLPARSLLTSRRSFVPAMYCLLGYGHPACIADTNGSAAGQDLGSATLSALLEAIERDALAIWWYNRARRPRVEAPDQYAWFRTAFPRRSLTLLDITTDMDVPVVAAVSANEDGRIIVVGTAADPDGNRAAMRAVAEAAQLISGVPARQPRVTNGLSQHERAVIRWWRTASLTTEAYLRPGRGVRRFPPWRGSDPLAHCLKQLEKQGLEAFRVDQTRPETGVPVVRVIVPGLRSAWARFGPGRLFEVPVELGWLKRRKQEDDLNPHFFPW